MSTAAATAISPAATPAQPSRTFEKSLHELMEDGIYLLFLLRNGHAPKSLSEYHRRVDHFLGQFEANARNLEKTPAAISDAKYAFCALMDEIVLSSNFSIRTEWERAPLQLRLFGEHLAGENFFAKLEKLRLDPVANVEVLEIFYTVLLLGFQGKYLIEGTEKLDYLISRLGQEITHARGGRADFAPNWKLPQRFQSYVRNELPLWLFYALLAIIATALFFAFRWLLGGETEALAQDQSRPALTAPAADKTGEPASSTPQAAKPRTAI